MKLRKLTPLALLLLLASCGAANAELRPAGEPAASSKAAAIIPGSVVGNVTAEDVAPLGLTVKRLDDAEARALGALDSASFTAKRYGWVTDAGGKAPQILESYRALVTYQDPDASGRYKAGEEVLAVVTSYADPSAEWWFEVADAKSGDVLTTAMVVDDSMVPSLETVLEKPKD